MPPISVATRTILEECIEHAVRVRVDYGGCIGRALHILRAVEPGAPHVEAWQMMESLMAETLGLTVTERLAAQATRH